MNLSEAQEHRRARLEDALDARIERALDRAGLSEGALLSGAGAGGVELGTADVSPSARVKLKGILKRLARQAHPFTQCMSDLRKHRPEWSDDRRKKTCNVLKALSGRGSGGKATAMTESCLVVDLDDDVVALLERVNLEALAELSASPDIGSGGAQTPPQEVAV